MGTTGTANDDQTETNERTDTVLRALHPRVAFVFDFDETLAPSTTDALLEHLDIDPDEFRTDRVEPLVSDGWQVRLAEAQALVDLSRGDHGPITEKTFDEVAQELDLYPGVNEMFDVITDAVHDIEPDVEVEFHLVTAGFVHIPQATPIADRFTQILGAHWAFDADGAIAAPKNTLGHYEKVRHLLALAKGLDSIASNQSDDVNAEIDPADWHVPFEQIVFVGDGDSDMPAFDLMESRGGVAIAVRQAANRDSWESRDAMRDGRRVAALMESDFRNDSPLMTALCASGQRAALWIRTLRAGRR